MCVRVVLRGQRSLLRQAVQIRHGGIADDLFVGVVFLDDHHDETVLRRGLAGSGLPTRSG